MCGAQEGEPRYAGMGLGQWQGRIARGLRGHGEASEFSKPWESARVTSLQFPEGTMHVRQYRKLGPGWQDLGAFGDPRLRPVLRSRVPSASPSPLPTSPSAGRAGTLTTPPAIAQSRRSRFPQQFISRSAPAATHTAAL